MHFSGFVIVEKADIEHIEDDNNELTNYVAEHLRSLGECHHCSRGGELFDWLQFGGRWNNHYGKNILSIDEALALGKDNIPYYLVDVDCEYLETHEFMQFVNDEKYQAYLNMLNIYKNDDDYCVLVVDFHN